MTSQILAALCQGALFLDDLPEGAAFDRADLRIPADPPLLNLNQKLGHLYEDALACILQHSPRYTLLEQGLQLQRGKHQTVGELDFLFRDHQRNTLVHLELATKFYLAVEQPSELLLPGPDARDNYYRKLDRMRTHQLTLVQYYRDLLPPAYQEEEIEVQQLVIGCLFDHVHAAAPAQPPYTRSGIRRGSWVHQSDYLTHFPDPAPLIIPKPLWPAALSTINRDTLSPLDLTSPLDRCIMVTPLNTPTPVFIAPDYYPQQPALGKTTYKQ